MFLRKLVSPVILVGAISLSALAIWGPITHAAAASYPAALAAGEQVTITGQVVGPDDRPVPQAHVVLSHWEQHYDRYFSVATATAPDGTFSLTTQVLYWEGSLQVGAMKEGFSVEWCSAEPGQEVLLRLAADPASCSGIVFDTDGRPLAGARVYVRLLARGGEEKERSKQLCLGDDNPLFAVSDEHGHYEITGLLSGSLVRLGALAEGFARGSSPGYASAGRSDVHLLLSPEATISGRVTCDGEPISAVRVFCMAERYYDGGGQTVTAADGSYALEHLPRGSYVVMLDPPEGFTAVAVEGVELSPGQHWQHADLELTPGGVISGTVTEGGTGKPLAGVLLSARSRARPRGCNAFHMLLTDQDGKYALRVPPGEADMQYFPCGARQYGFWRCETPAYEREITEGSSLGGLDFVLRPPDAPDKRGASRVLRGQVLLPDGQPAANVGVAPISEFYIGLLDNHLRTRTDDEGNFVQTLSRAPRDEIVLALFACDVRRDLVGLTLVDDPDHPVQIRLWPGPYVQASVVDADGNRLAHTPVTVAVQYEHTNGWSFVTVRTNEQGILRVGPLAPEVGVKVGLGPETARLAEERPWQDLGYINLSPGQQYDLPPLVLNPKGRTMRGWVGDQNQRPIVGAIVVATGTPEASVSDADGDFELTGLPMIALPTTFGRKTAAHGKVTIVAIHPTKPLAAVEQLDPDWGQEPGFILQPLGSFTGQVVDEQGQPVSEAVVRCRPTFGFPNALYRRLREHGFRNQTVADQEGKWGIEALLPNQEYIVSVSPPAGRRATGGMFTARSGEAVHLGRMVAPPAQ